MRKIRGEQEQGLKKERQRKKRRDKPGTYSKFEGMLMGILKTKVYKVIGIWK